jgi:dihydrodipicolinate synthase/N-acetylneuraminate lyase
MDQAALLRKYKFPCVMMLPCGDPRDAAGLARGLREIAEAASTPLVLYLKEENNFGADKEAGLDVVARLVEEGVCVWIKYAVVRQDPSQDPYLESLLRRVDPGRVVSGIGERPAVIHLRDWKLPGFTTGSGCIAPSLSRAVFEACQRGDFDEAEKLRAEFIPLEDLRDRWSPAKTLHYATQLAGIAETGSVPPFLSELPHERLEEIAPVARKLLERNALKL